jgi:hypothetical protein
MQQQLNTGCKTYQQAQHGHVECGWNVGGGSMHRPESSGELHARLVCATPQGLQQGSCASGLGRRGASALLCGACS